MSRINIFQGTPHDAVFNFKGGHLPITQFEIPEGLIRTVPIRDMTELEKTYFSLYEERMIQMNEILMSLSGVDPRLIESGEELNEAVESARNNISQEDQVILAQLQKEADFYENSLWDLIDFDIEAEDIEFSKAECVELDLRPGWKIVAVVCAYNRNAIEFN